MRVQWSGQSAFHLSGSDMSVAIDPFGDLSGLESRGLRFDYPSVDGASSAFDTEQLPAGDGPLVIVPAAP